MIVVISATNRAGSNTLTVAQDIVKRYKKQGAEVQLLDLKDVPNEIFHPDAYAEKPAAFEPFQKMILEAKGLHVVTPEYNGTFAGAFKLFIDMLKFPESFQSVNVAYTGVAAGIWGGIRSVEQLLHVFGYRNGFTFPERVFISGVNQKLDDSGNITDEKIDGMLDSQVKNFITFVDATYPKFRQGVCDGTK